MFHKGKKCIIKLSNQRNRITTINVCRKETYYIQKTSAINFGGLVLFNLCPSYFDQPIQLSLNR